MKRFLGLVPILFCFVLSSCVLAPQMSPKTARTVGKGKFEIEGGYEHPDIAASLAYGLTDRVDIGALGAFEQTAGIVVGVFGRVGLIVPDASDGLAVAMLGGGFYEAIGNSDGRGKGVYLGPIVSYKYKWFEPYFNTRYNYVHYSDVRVRTDNDFVVEMGSSTLHYAQQTLGATAWVTKNIGLSGNVKVLHRFDDLTDGAWTAGVTLVLRP